MHEPQLNVYLPSSYWPTDSPDTTGRSTASRVAVWRPQRVNPSSSINSHDPWRKKLKTDLRGEKRGGGRKRITLPANPHQGSKLGKKVWSHSLPSGDDVRVKLSSLSSKFFRWIWKTFVATLFGGGGGRGATDTLFHNKGDLFRKFGGKVTFLSMCQQVLSKIVVTILRRPRTI